MISCDYYLRHMQSTLGVVSSHTNLILASYYQAEPVKHNPKVTVIHHTALGFERHSLRRHLSLFLTGADMWPTQGTLFSPTTVHVKGGTGAQVKVALHVPPQAVPTALEWLHMSLHVETEAPLVN